MISKHIKINFAAIIAGLFLLLGTQEAQAQFDIRSFGLSGQPTALDSIVEQGEYVHIVLGVEVPVGWTINGVGIEGGSRFEVRVYYYSQNVPTGTPSAAGDLLVDSTSFVVNSGVEPQRVSFRVKLPEVIGLQIRSLQFALGVIGIDDEENIHYTQALASHIDVEEYNGLAVTPDAQHMTYLRVQPVSVSRPTIHQPVENDTVSRSMLVLYDQPLDARRRTLQLEIRETPETGGLLLHRLFLTDTAAGLGKQLLVNGLNLLATPGVDSLAGTNSLNHRSRLELRMYYDRRDNGARSDTARVQNLFADLQTESPTFIEPRLGSESPSPEVRVIYRLPEQASIVQLRFDADSASLVPDPLSPHIITLVSSLYSAQEHYFVLDGSNIGTGGPFVLENNNGSFDALVSQTLYNVTLSYRDRVGNPIASATNFGYIWPEDLTTVPPRLIAPVPGGVDNSSFWVEFDLPEQPLPGSVYLLFTAIPPAPGSPHAIYLDNLNSAGIRGLFLNAQALNLSGPPVTRVEGGNSFVHNSRYVIRVFYRDISGNPEAGSSPRTATYDGATEAPFMFSPVSFDTFRFTGTEVTFRQPERGSPGTVKLIIEQTGGPVADPLSPHTLYLSNSDSGEVKSVFFNASFLGPGAGIDSVQNAGSLVSRGRYRLTFAYRDALLNAEASHSVNELIFPSGSAVSVQGNPISSTVIPGAGNVPLLQLSFRAEGESALRSLRLAVEGGLQPSDIIAREFVLWSSADSILQTDLDSPLDSLDSWFAGDMIFDSLVFPISDAERYVIVAGRFSGTANPANQANLVFRDGTYADCGGDPVFCAVCPIGVPDFALPVEVSSFSVGPDTTFSALVVTWIVESEFNTLGFRLWRFDSDTETERIVASYADHPELYGRGSAATSKRYSVVDRGLRAGVTYTYRIDAIGMNGLTTYPVGLQASGTPAVAPDNFDLRRIYPNPFNQEVYIEFVAPFSQVVELKIYNILGHPVRNLVRAQLAPANYRVRWDATDDTGVHVPSGVYIVHLRAAGRFDASQKVLLIR